MENYNIMCIYSCYYCFDDYRNKGKTDTFLLNTVYENMYKYILPDKEKEFFTQVIELAKEGKDIDFLLGIDLYSK